MMLLLAVLTSSVSAMAQQPQSLEDAQIHDGDTLAIGQRRIRIADIDAPELRQTCRRADGADWVCGEAATEALRALVVGGVTCITQSHDRYGREVASCTNGRKQDLGAEMVRLGWALAYTRFSAAYIAQEATARQAQAGIWSGSFLRPEEFRHRGR